VAVLIVAGFQVPVIAGVLVELAGSNGAGLFWHSCPIAAKVGVTRAVVSIVNVVDVAQELPDGVKV